MVGIPIARYSLKIAMAIAMAMASKIALYQTLGNGKKRRQ